ncbi:hypothetical protein D932_02253 [Enterococcus casseliflavus 14-MB-W-14]|nr:hypothetical protein D932_02253 [Enterococcus casseliflavus 14-MB-W-14]EPH87407.1 hypothetical protein D922_04336 [Enterococcus faecalis 06-MB-DW-09]
MLTDFPPFLAYSITKCRHKGRANQKKEEMQTFLLSEGLFS